jgi:hypothetical protein
VQFNLTFGPKMTKKLAKILDSSQISVVVVVVVAVVVGSAKIEEKKEI